MNREKKKPAGYATGGDSLETLLKIDDKRTVAGSSDGVKAGYVFADADWIDHAERVLHYLVASGAPFTVDDLRKLGVPEPDKQQRWGCVFAAARNRGFIKHFGFTQHMTPGGSSMPLRVWVGASESTETF